MTFLYWVSQIGEMLLNLFIAGMLGYLMYNLILLGMMLPS
jgi:hypothetical protein